jgi:osmotically-inducible protein OsmY
MRTNLFVTLTAIVALVAIGCDETMTSPAPTTPTTPSTTPSTAPTNDATQSDSTEPAAPDNSAVNERDASGVTKTPIDQGENSADVKTTAEIRQRITGDSSMSINARNIKIVTSQGKVTLRGPVASAAEKDAIDKMARDVAGSDNVDNQLEIAQP